MPFFPSPIYAWHSLACYRPAEINWQPLTQETCDMELFYKLFIDSGSAVVSLWLGIFLVSSLLMTGARFFSHFRNVKIQQRNVSWSKLRHELLWSTCNVFCATFVLQTVSSWLVDQGYLYTDPAPTTWYVVLFEFIVYFFVFDFYFYCVHRVLHTKPLYRWIHLTHHRSVLTNPASYASMNPIEGISEGMIIPIFLACFTVHETSTYFILPFASLMGLYVHCGYEFAPRWWYQSSVSKWFITPMYHDQHHQYFTVNFGAVTTIWDRVFKTKRERFDSDFLAFKDRPAVTKAIRDTA